MESTDNGDGLYAELLMENWNNEGLDNKRSLKSLERAGVRDSPTARTEIKRPRTFQPHAQTPASREGKGAGA